MKTQQERLQRARDVIQGKRYDLIVFDELEEPACRHCGRIIYCGKSKLCRNPKCGSDPNGEGQDCKP